MQSKQRKRRKRKGVVMPEHRLRAVDSTGYNPSAAIGGGGGGGEMLEPRVARLESDVEHIKVNLVDIRADLRVLGSNSSIMQRDTAVIMQKLVDIENAISKKRMLTTSNPKLLHVQINKSYGQSALCLSSSLPQPA